MLQGLFPFYTLLAQMRISEVGEIPSQLRALVSKPTFDPWDSYGVKKEPTPTSCPEASIHPSIQTHIEQM